VAEGIKLPKVQRKEMHFLTAAQVEALAEAIAPPYGTLIRVAGYTGLRPCEYVALKVGRLDLLRGTVRAAEAAPEVAGHLEWGGVKTHEARTVRLPRSLAEELGAYLAGRPTGREELVFTAPRGGPLRESKFVPDRFKPAIAAANQAIIQLPPDSRPELLPEDLRLYDLRHTAASLMIRQGGQRQGRATPARPRHGQHHPGHLRAPVPRRAGRPCRPLGGRPRRRPGHPRTDPTRTSGRAPAGTCRSVSGLTGAGGGARTLTPLRAQRF
jgi:integrase